MVIHGPLQTRGENKYALRYIWPSITDDIVDSYHFIKIIIVSWLQVIKTVILLVYYTILFDFILFLVLSGQRILPSQIQKISSV